MKVKSTQLLLLIFLSLIGLINSFIVPFKTDVQDIYDDLPEDEKEPFISYFLMKGYNQTYPIFDIPHIHYDKYPYMPSLYKKFEDLPLPTRFPRRLLKWVESRFQVPHNDIPILAYGQIICPPSEFKKCIDLSDIGQNCCPI